MVYLQQTSSASSLQIQQVTARVQQQQQQGEIAALHHKLAAAERQTQEQEELLRNTYLALQNAEAAHAQTQVIIFGLGDCPSSGWMLPSLKKFCCKQKKDCSFDQPTRLITCANYGKPYVHEVETFNTVVQNPQMVLPHS